MLSYMYNTVAEAVSTVTTGVGSMVEDVGSTCSGGSIADGVAVQEKTTVVYDRSEDEDSVVLDPKLLVEYAQAQEAEIAHDREDGPKPDVAAQQEVVTGAAAPDSWPAPPPPGPHVGEGGEAPDCTAADKKADQPPPASADSDLEYGTDIEVCRGKTRDSTSQGSAAAYRLQTKDDGSVTQVGPTGHVTQTAKYSSQPGLGRLLSKDEPARPVHILAKRASTCEAISFSEPDLTMKSTLRRQSLKLRFMSLETVMELRGQNLKILGEFQGGRRSLLVDTTLRKGFSVERTSDTTWRLHAPPGERALEEKLSFTLSAASSSEADQWVQRLEQAAK